MPPLPATQQKLADDVRELLWFGDDDPDRSELEASRSMAAAAAKAVGLKPFPAIAQRVLGMLADPNVSAVQVRRAVEQDPALSARLLRVANSALYAGARPCQNIEDAVVRLGARTLGEIVAGVAALGLFADSRGLGETIRDHSVGVAAVARVLATEWNCRGVDNIFLGGLLHDVGKLLTIQVDEIDYGQVPRAALEHADEIHVVERALTGYDHAVLGAHVLLQWKLPSDVAMLVAWHHQPGRAYSTGGNAGIGVALLRLADRIEYLLRRAKSLDEATLDELMKDGAVEYAQFSRDVMKAMWPKLAEADRETRQALFAR
jgi:putative nucleotidyltransferase with HDIG domain